MPSTSPTCSLHTAPIAAAVLVAQDDLVTVVPQAFGRHAPTLLPVRCVPLPQPAMPIPIAQAWHPRFDDEPAHRWLRALIKQVARDFAPR